MVQRKDLSEAVEEFIRAEEPRTRSADGKRAQLSPKYHYNRSIMLRRFADTFQCTAVSELGKHHLDLFMGALEENFDVETAKSRNHYRAAIRQFIAWAVRKDFLAPTNRLAEADSMRPELANTAEILFYTPAEFRTLLAAESTSRSSQSRTRLSSTSLGGWPLLSLSAST
jgi:hypothetical protein